MDEVLAAGVVLVPSPDPRAMERLIPGWLGIEGGRVVAAGPGEPPGPAVRLGATTVLAPGFVDLQVNGVGDVDFATATPPRWTDARLLLAASGVTGFCATFVTAPLDAYPRMLDAAEAVHGTGPGDGSVMEGVHLEGPFLGGAPGAHPVDLLRPADPVWVEDLLDSRPGLVRIVTLAPEADPGGVGTAMLAARGVVVSLGHSRASYAEAEEAFGAGARMATHVFNGMGPFHHREPGLAGAALDDERVTVGVIADLAHVHPAVLRLVARVKADAALVTDSVAVGPASGAADARGTVRLADGTLYGTSLTMLRAVWNLTAAGVGLDRAVAMASVVPARLIGLDTFGASGVGGRADLVAFTAPPSLPAPAGPAPGRAVGTWIDGRRVWGAGDRR